MNKYTLKTVLGDFDYEVIEKKGREYIATISKTDGNRYLKLNEVPAPVIAFLKKAGYKIELFNADLLNYALGLQK